MSVCEVCGKPLPLPSRRRANTTCRRCGSTYEFAPVSEEELYQRAVVQANPQLHKSETMSVTISRYAPAFGVMLAVRVQDIPRGIWHNWDRDVGWDRTPIVVTPGTGTLYIAAAARQDGSDGYLTLTITDDIGNTLVTKTEWVATGSWVGVETGSINMPNRDYVITISVTP